MTQSEMIPVAAGRSPTPPATQSLGFLVGICLCLVLSLGFAAGMFRSSAGAVEIDPGEQINPNEAPAASLIRLPGIGLGRARAIVAYRDQVGAQPGRPPVFTTADDLQNIKGIGPAITDDVRPWLQFGDPSEVGNAPSAR